MWLMCLFCLSAAASEPMFPGFDPAKVAAVTLVRPGETGPQIEAQLKRRGHTWVLPRFHQFPAEKLYVTILLNQLKTLPRGQVVALDNGNDDPYGMKDGYRRVTCRDETGAVLVDLMVGRPGETVRQVHVRLVGEEKVTLVTSDLYPAVHRPMWTQRMVQQMHPNLLTGVSLRHGEQQFSAEKDNAGVWRVTSPGPGRPSAAFTQQLAPYLVKLRAGKVRYRAVDEAASADWVIQQKVAGVELTLNLNRAEDGLWVRRGDEPFEFQLDPKIWELLVQACAVE